MCNEGGREGADAGGGGGHALLAIHRAPFGCTLASLFLSSNLRSSLHPSAKPSSQRPLLFTPPASTCRLLFEPSSSPLITNPAGPGSCINPCSALEKAPHSPSKLLHSVPLLRRS